MVIPKFSIEICCRCLSSNHNRESKTIRESDCKNKEKQFSGKHERKIKYERLLIKRKLENGW